MGDGDARRASRVRGFCRDAPATLGPVDVTDVAGEPPSSGLALHAPFLHVGGESTCADIHVSPSGAFVYASNRSHDSIVIHRIDPFAGTLVYVGHASTQERTPRSFGIDPTGRFLLAANQDSDSVVIFRIDADSGKLQPTGRATQVPAPVCVKLLRDA